MSTTNLNLKKSPIGEIQWMAAVTPYKDKKTGKESYSLKLAFDVKKDAKWLEEISELNDAKVVTAQKYKGKKGTPAYEKAMSVLSTGKAFVEAKSNFKPEVYDKEGNILEEAPYFYTGSTGTAQIYYEEYRGEKGNTINLVGIKIHTLESPEGTEPTGVDREIRLAQLREMAQSE